VSAGKKKDQGGRAVTETTTAWTNGVLATMDPEVDDQYGLLRGRVLVTRGEKILGVHPEGAPAGRDADDVVDLGGALVTPGLVDCHTHLVHGGDRAAEWEARLNGVDYSQIAASGGGIKSTVRATRDLTPGGLLARAAARLECLLADGATTVEIKSGYGLSLEEERKILRVVARLKGLGRADISPTLLAAHAVPPEHAGNPDAWVDVIVGDVMPDLWREGLYEAVDVWIEKIGFSVPQAKKIYDKARELGVPVKAHAEQMSDVGGSALVASMGGWSSDHLECLGERGAEALGRAGTVAVLLPGAFYFLKDTRVPPVDLLRKYKVPMAVASDYNPGTSPFCSLRLAMNMACTLFGLTPLEAFVGATRNAARALGRGGVVGQLKAGFRADLAVWRVGRPVEIFYELGFNPLAGRVFKGVPCAPRPGPGFLEEPGPPAEPAGPNIDRC
jgi:imidazolonepropionase